MTQLVALGEQYGASPETRLPRHQGRRAHTNLSIGQIVRVFRNSDRWALLNWGLPHDGFLTKLVDVREILNEVAHFRPTR